MELSSAPAERDYDRVAKELRHVRNKIKKLQAKEKALLDELEGLKGDREGSAEEKKGSVRRRSSRLRKSESAKGESAKSESAKGEGAKGEGTKGESAKAATETLVSFDDSHDSQGCDTSSASTESAEHLGVFAMGALGKKRRNTLQGTDAPPSLGGMGDAHRGSSCDRIKGLDLQRASPARKRRSSLYQKYLLGKEKGESSKGFSIPLQSKKFHLSGIDKQLLRGGLVVLDEDDFATNTESLSRRSASDNVSDTALEEESDGSNARSLSAPPSPKPGSEAAAPMNMAQLLLEQRPGGGGEGEWADDGKEGEGEGEGDGARRHKRRMSWLGVPKGEETGDDDDGSVIEAGRVPSDLPVLCGDGYTLPGVLYIEERSREEVLKRLFNSSRLDLAVAFLSGMMEDSKVRTSAHEGVMAMFGHESARAQIELLKYATAMEVRDATQAGTLFRGRSVSNTLITIFRRTYGGAYIKKVISPVIDFLSEANGSFELDTASGDYDAANVERVRGLLDVVLDALMSSVFQFPSEFQEICHFLRKCVREKFPDDEMVGVLNFFDRYICAALAKPSLFGIELRKPRYVKDEAVQQRHNQRGLLLVSKVLQRTISNRQGIGADEWMKSVHSWTFRAEPELLGMMDKWSRAAPGDTYAEHAEAPESDCNPVSVLNEVAVRANIDLVSSCVSHLRLSQGEAESRPLGETMSDVIATVTRLRKQAGSKKSTGIDTLLASSEDMLMRSMYSRAAWLALVNALRSQSSKQRNASSRALIMLAQCIKRTPSSDPPSLDIHIPEDDGELLTAEAAIALAATIDKGVPGSVTQLLLAQFCSHMPRNYYDATYSETLGDLIEGNELLEAQKYSKAHRGEVTERLAEVTKGIVHRAMAALETFPAVLWRLFRHLLLEYDVDPTPLFFVTVLCPVLQNPERYGLARNFATPLPSNTRVSCQCIMNLLFRAGNRTMITSKSSHMSVLNSLIEEVHPLVSEKLSKWLRGNRPPSCLLPFSSPSREETSNAISVGLKLLKDGRIVKSLRDTQFKVRPCDKPAEILRAIHFKGKGKV